MGDNLSDEKKENMTALHNLLLRKLKELQLKLEQDEQFPSTRQDLTILYDTIKILKCIVFLGIVKFFKL